MILCRTRKFRGLPQMSDTLPTILTGPARDKLKDSVDRVTLLGRPLLDCGNQQLIDAANRLVSVVPVGLGALGIAQPHYTRT